MAVKMSQQGRTVPSVKEVEENTKHIQKSWLIRARERNNSTQLSQ